MCRCLAVMEQGQGSNQSVGAIPCLTATRSAATTAAVRVTFAVVPATSLMIASTSANSAARNRGVKRHEVGRDASPSGRPCLGGHLALQLGVHLPRVVLAGPRNDLGVSGALHQWTEQISNHGLVQRARYPDGHNRCRSLGGAGRGRSFDRRRRRYLSLFGRTVGRRLAFKNHAISWFAAPFGRRPGNARGYDRQRWWWQQIVDLVIEPGRVKGRSPGGHEVTPTAGSGWCRPSCSPTRSSSSRASC